jgi:ADP-dependent NAD(P)H-hydrate dehydratase / NAD(P)H-hydrate epimerase
MDKTLITKLCECGKLQILTQHPTGSSYYWLPTRSTLTELLLPIPTNCHKGHFGHILVFEGHPQFLGASRLAAIAALRAGAGLLTIAADNTVAPTSLDRPEFMHIKISDITDNFLSKIDALVIGPGLSRITAWQKKALNFLNSLKTHVPCIVVDADALPLLNHPDLTLHGKHIIATPHAKEAAGLLTITPKEVEQDQVLAIQRLAELPCNQKNHIIWLLKGSTTLVRSTDGTIFAIKGELPLLSAGGMGDVLSGAIAGLCKQTSSPLCATILAVSLQIESAALLSKLAFKGILASEVADMFPKLTKNRP